MSLNLSNLSLYFQHAIISLYSLKYLSRNHMNSFDPFLSSEYKKNFPEEFQVEEEPELVKKTESQFISNLFNLQLSIPMREVQEHSEFTSLSEKDSQSSKHENSYTRLVIPLARKKYETKTSPFHNFQKHLVITLRQNLTMKQLLLKAGIQYELALNIFNYFKNSLKTSRQFLEQVFGISGKEDSYGKDIRKANIQNGQLKQFFQNFQFETVLKAQQILRQSVSLQLDEWSLIECLRRRKIQKKQQFIAYVDLFKRQLINGKERKKTYKMLAKRIIQQSQPKNSSQITSIKKDEIILDFSD